MIIVSYALSSLHFLSSFLFLFSSYSSSFFQFLLTLFFHCFMFFLLFNRRFGDVIESIFMQEVPEHEQPLYARLVVRPGAINMIDGLLDGTSRMKFVINGKHVWARRYLRKGNKSPQTSSSYDSPFGADPSH
ncbi:hypothetical protein Lalb_Chr19g0129091 [Lupinus albus]|uniref:Uncharacterized protein n=1 Tax=Lupinus albus TaxID=3870 RepID=A0A6A4P0D5_LUPAL|nr:hypothetical protein Lalb_Chr19g0129091 [Lupinus albus]